MSNPNSSAQNKPQSITEKPQDSKSKNFTTGSDALAKKEANKPDEAVNEPRDEKGGKPVGVNFPPKKPENENNTPSDKEESPAKSDKR